MKAVITVTGKDKKGIIATVSAFLAEKGVNIEDISQTILDEYFAMIMLVDIADSERSLSEIAENSGIPRQGVHDNIKRAATELKAYEEKLGLFARFSDITDAANEIKKLLSSELDSKSELYTKVSALLDTIIDEA